MTTAERVAPRLKQRYKEQIAGELREEFSFANVMQIPGVVKVVVNMGVGDAARDAKLIDGAVRDLATITGQKPQVRRATKSIAQFKLRQGMPIGAMVTLRGERMWEFLDRFISIALPRVSDFRGVSPASFDGSGNYAIGLREQVIFPEISYDSIDTTRGLDVAIVTTTESDEEARELLRLLGMPFRQS
jgi:large subunit ribosomal protein L5